MKTKTIEVDLALYDLLSEKRQEGQTISQLIEEEIGGGASRHSTGADLLRALAKSDPSEDLIESLDRVVAERDRDPVRIPQL